MCGVIYWFCDYQWVNMWCGETMNQIQRNKKIAVRSTDNITNTCLGSVFVCHNTMCSHHAQNYVRVVRCDQWIINNGWMIIETSTLTITKDGWSNESTEVGEAFRTMRFSCGGDSATAFTPLTFSAIVDNSSITSNSSTTGVSCCFYLISFTLSLYSLCILNAPVMHMFTHFVLYCVPVM